MASAETTAAATAAATDVDCVDGTEAAVLALGDVGIEERAQAVPLVAADAAAVPEVMQEQ